MDQLTCYDVAQYNRVSVVVVDSDHVPPDPSVVVLPLVHDDPAVRQLNPEIVHDGRRFILATRLMSAVRRTSVRRTGNVADQGDRITRAIDVLMAGV